MFSHDVKRVSLRLMRELDTPRALTVAILIENSEWDQLLSLQCDPAFYEPLYFCGVEKYRRDVQATDFLRKCEGDQSTDAAKDRSEQMELECWEKFLLCEKECYLANVRLQPFIDGTWETNPLNDTFFTIVKKARNWLLKVLGPVPDGILSSGRFGPGKPFESELWPRRVRNNCVAYDKLQNHPMFTVRSSENWVQLDPILKQVWGEHPDPSAICRGDRFATVPKTAKVRRPIALGPGVNVFWQLAVNDVLVERLRRTGIHIKRDINSHSYTGIGDPTRGQALHRRLAQQNSVSNEAATVDLSSASDLNAYNLIRLLLDTNESGDWFDLLCSLRSPSIRYMDRWVRLEKFSAMGNGFTFPVETLAFCALLHGVGCTIGLDTFVYGDDMVIPRQFVKDALAVLKFVGHSPNLKKTYTDGYFRESCGGDFLNGHDVRPYYLKKEPSNASNWISVANNLWRRSLEWQMPELNAVRNAVLDLVPSDVRACRGPQALGDLVVWDHQSRWNCKVRGSRRFFRVWKPVTKTIHLKSICRQAVDSIWWAPHEVREYVHGDVAIAASLLGYAVTDGLSPRESVEGYKIGRVVYS